MKIVFFGLGSIGQRHLRLLKKKFKHDVYALRTNKGQLAFDQDVFSLKNWQEVIKTKPDIAFITNPTSLHIKTAIKCVDLGMNIFMEKPIDSTEGNLDLLISKVRSKKIACYIAYNLRFHPVISFLKKYLKDKLIYHVNVYNCSMLSEWRRNQDYKKSYSAIRKKGGGVILDLSHEFDYIEYLFGDIRSMKGTFDRASDITYDAEDFADVIIKTKNTNVNLHLNFLSFNRERTLKIDCENEFILADLISSKITIIGKKKERRRMFIKGLESSYEKQLDYFMANKNNPSLMNNLQQASKLFKKIIKFKNSEK